MESIGGKAVDVVEESLEGGRAMMPNSNGSGSAKDEDVVVSRSVSNDRSGLLVSSEESSVRESGVGGITKWSLVCWFHNIGAGDDDDEDETGGRGVKGGGYVGARVMVTSTLGTVAVGVKQASDGDADDGSSATG